MASRDQYYPRPVADQNTTPFENVEEAWFWFIAAQQAKNDGARIAAGLGVGRPCEPADILQVLNRLYRNRRLLMDHLLVLRHYGRRYMAPDPRRVKEVRAHRLWQEAFSRLEPVLERKGIVRKAEALRPTCSANWIGKAVVYEEAEV